MVDPLVLEICLRIHNMAPEHKKPMSDDLFGQ